MADTTGLPLVLPYGIRDVKVAVIAGDGSLGTPIDLPNATTFTFSEAEDFTELRGDDGLVAMHGKGPAVNWELEGGGVSFDAVKALFGGATVFAGTGPTATRKFQKAGTDVRPYFQVEGQAISDSGGDFHAVLFKCRATGEFTGALTDGAFWLTGAKGTALPDARGVLYEFVQNGSQTAIGATMSPSAVPLA